ncbi:unnamed protein product [Closterium sp. Naga37s-1]|nr:unnamed protein product [Closterium sp. Naga37s-1]
MSIQTHRREAVFGEGIFSNSTPSLRRPLPSLHPRVSGGAIYAKDAFLTFVKATLNYNKALGTATVNTITTGEGGAAYAAATGRNSEAAVRFCSLTFQANTAKFTDDSTLYMEMGWGSSWAAVLSICDRSKPTGTVVPTSGWKLVTGCPASTCNA